MTTNTIQQYDSHTQTINALLDDIRVAAAYHKQACSSASNHAPAFLFEIKMVEDALREALAYLTGEDN